MRVRRLDSELWLPCELEDVYAFFADARNLERITPPWLKFEVLTPAPITMKPGARIDYRLRVHGLPLRWQSEITAWEPPFRFVDEQVRGPYRMWKHEHHFEEKDGGTLCLDRVHYAVPGGAILDRLFVRRDLDHIFQFRRRRLQEIFAEVQSDGAEESASSQETPTEHDSPIFATNWRAFIRLHCGSRSAVTSVEQTPSGGRFYSVDCRTAARDNNS